MSHQPKPYRTITLGAPPNEAMLRKALHKMPPIEKILLHPKDSAWMRLRVLRDTNTYTPATDALLKKGHGGWWMGIPIWYRRSAQRWNPLFVTAGHKPGRIIKVTCEEPPPSPARTMKLVTEYFEMEARAPSGVYHGGDIMVPAAYEDVEVLAPQPW